MSLLSWLDNVKPTRGLASLGRRSRRKPAARCRLRFEALEDRRCPSSGSIGTPLAQPDAAAQVRAGAAYGRLPLSFEANHGQTNPAVNFLSRGSGYTLFLTP